MAIRRNNAFIGIEMTSFARLQGGEINTQPKS
jgi:hypothetical protein